MGAPSRSWALALALSLLSKLALAQELDEEEQELEEPAQPEETEETPQEAAQPSWALQLTAEAGIGMRDVSLPREGVVYQIGTGVHPALGLAFALDHHSSERVSVGLAARYQSSLGLVLNEQLTGGAPHARNTRSHYFEVGITPSVHWDASGWAITGMLGYSVSELDPLNHLVTPSYHLAGPHAGARVRVPLGSARVGLRVGGDGQLTLQVGDELRARGVLGSGFAAGMNATLEAQLGEHWWIAVSYREQRYWLGTQQTESFTDATRFVTAQLRGVL
jgi:hypothetical protein